MGSVSLENHICVPWELRYPYSPSTLQHTSKDKDMCPKCGYKQDNNNNDNNDNNNNNNKYIIPDSLFYYNVGDL